MSTADDFWPHSGLSLLDVSADGWLLVTDDFLRAYLWRPEIRPVEESCAAERALHAALNDAPRRSVTETELAALADADARDNYRILLAFFGRLTSGSAPTLEAAYLGIFKEPGGVQIAPLFIDQLAHILIHHVVARMPNVGVDPAFITRAAELWFREQQVTIQEHHILLADEETIEMQHARQKEGTQFGNLGRLLVEAQTAAASIELDILTRENAAHYWARDERHDMVLQVNTGRPGNEALARVLEAWIGHFFRTPVTITSLQKIETAQQAWFVGLDAQATHLLNALYNGEPLTDDAQRRLLALYRLTWQEPSIVPEEARPRPVFMALAMNENNQVRMKPQNLLLNLPLQSSSKAST